MPQPNAGTPQKSAPLSPEREALARKIAAGLLARKAMRLKERREQEKG
jgi:hypothetical protein